MFDLILNYDSLSRSVQVFLINDFPIVGVLVGIVWYMMLADLLSPWNLIKKLAPPLYRPSLSHVARVINGSL